MKILLASIQLPWPLDSGGRVALFSSISCLCKDHNFTLVCPVWDEKRLNDAEALQTLLPEVKIRAVYCGPAEPTNSKKGDVLGRSLSWVAWRYWKWRFPVSQEAPKQNDLEIPYYPFTPLPDAFINALSFELSQGIDLVQAEFAEMLSLGTWLPPGIPRIFIHHQPHFVYAGRFSEVRKRSGYSGYLENVMRIQEEAFLQDFDGVVVFSDADKRILGEVLEDEKIYVSPFPIACSSSVASAQFDPIFTFVGSEEHFPNYDALEWLTTAIWPDIATQTPNARLKVIGRWGQASMTRLSRPGVEFTGFVPDLEDAIRGSVLLVPLRIGSGIRVKLLNAMSQGVPAVSTSIGCEGITARDGMEILIRDEASGFAEAAAELLSDLQLRARIADAARNLIGQFYSPELVRQRRNDIYRNVLNHVAGPDKAKELVKRD